jgi:putative hydrolase of the HAD superfamily
MIKAVVFDYGGVICFFPPPEIGAELERLTGLPPETLMKLQRKYRGEYDRGIYNSREYYQFILSKVGIFPGDAVCEKIGRADMNGWKNLNPATIQLMRDIKAAGLALGILSNMPRDFLPWVRQNLAVFGEVDAAVFSCEYNLIKPEPAIYEKLRERLGCEYQEIVFFDDVPDNIAAANKLGITGIIWTGAEAARESLGKL